jgi:hypothetical protein
MAMAFRDCYKNLIYTLCDWTNWYGDDAKWIDSCDNSNDEDITLYTWNPVATSKLNQYWVGDGLLTKCTPGPLFAPNNLNAKVMNSMLFYFLNKAMNKSK